MTGCVFCSIAADNSPAHRLYENANTLAFLDIEPATRGHTLVIPKQHYETITDAPEGIVEAVFRTVRRVAVTLESVYEPDGVNIVQSNNMIAGQEVFHAHVHVIPRYEDDDIALSWIPEDIDKAEQQKIATRIRNELDSCLRSICALCLPQ